MYAGAWVSQHVESSWRADRCAWKEHTTKFWTIHRSVTSILEERCPVLRHGSNAHDSSSPTARSSPNECCRPNRAMIGKVCLRPVGTRGGRGDGWGPCACPGGLTSGLGCVRPTGLLPTRTSTRPLRPLSLQDAGRTFPHSVGKVHQVSTGNRTRATIKALPAPPHHPRPYGW